VAKSEQMAAYFADLASLYQSNGFEILEIFLDRNPTHSAKMQALFKELTPDLTIKTSFHLVAPYSPKLNLIEYAIHLIPQKVLHQADHKTELAQFESTIRELCDNHSLLNKEQTINILEHIEALVPAC
jgi:hypothetical protein